MATDGDLLAEEYFAASRGRRLRVKGRGGLNGGVVYTLHRVGVDVVLR